MCFKICRITFILKIDFCVLRRLCTIPALDILGILLNPNRLTDVSDRKLLPELCRAECCVPSAQTAPQAYYNILLSDYLSIHVCFTYLTMICTYVYINIFPFMFDSP